MVEVHIGPPEAGCLTPPEAGGGDQLEDALSSLVGMSEDRDPALTTVIVGSRDTAVT